MLENPKEDPIHRFMFRCGTLIMRLRAECFPAKRGHNCIPCGCYGHGYAGLDTDRIAGFFAHGRARHRVARAVFGGCRAGKRYFRL